MDQVRFAVIGAGSMGRVHLRNIADLENARAVAVCDISGELGKKTAAEFDCEYFSDYNKLFTRNICDAVLIATPHYQHTTIGIAALQAGCHVLVEKPISVHKADCQRLIAAHQNKKQVFAAMFNQRTDPRYQKIKQLIDDGELGELTRVNWIITDWFRTDAYYASGSWRATWAGEGGGVLLNQCPHQIDLLQWLCGMPKNVRGFCGLGKRHNIEVEDEVTAYLEFPSGATGVFIASTGEAPGTNRLEICGDRGKVLVEDDKILFTRNEVPASRFQKTTSDAMAKPDVWNIEIPAQANAWGPQHAEILQNFVNAIIAGEPLIAPAEEGIHSVELANAILYSSLVEKVIELPLDAAEYESKLKQLIENSSPD